MSEQGDNTTPSNDHRNEAMRDNVFEGPGASRRSTAMATTAAVDDGHANTKIAWMGSDGCIHTSLTPSIACYGLRTTSGMESSEEGGYRIEDADWSVGNFTDAEDTMSNAYPYSDANLAIIHHALREAGFAKQSAHHFDDLSVTLPMSKYYADPQAVTEKRAKSLSRTVQSVKSKDYPLTIEANGVRVLPEGMSAWIDQIVDEHGENAADPREPIAIMDMGGRTTDVVVMREGHGRIDLKYSGTEYIGFITLLERIHKLILIELGFNAAMTRIQEALTDNMLFSFGERYDISKIIANAKRETSGALLKTARRRLECAAELDRILCVGGGSEVLRDTLTNSEEYYGNIVVPDDPLYANARGALKYMIYKGTGT